MSGALLALAGAAEAEPAPPFRELLSAAQASPTLMIGEAEVSAAQARQRQAGAWRNPEVSLQSDNFAPSRPNAPGIEGPQTTLSLSETVELGGKRQARVAAARFTAEQARAEQRQTRADFAAKLAVAYAEAEADQARVAQAQEALAAAEADARAARLLLEAGKEAPLRSLQAAAETQAVRAEIESATAARDTAFARLSALAGTRDHFDALAESLLSRPASSMSAGASEPTPAVAAAEAARAAAAARVDVERRQAIPDVTVSAGVRRFTDANVTALVAGVSAPLPLFDSNRGATEAARAELRAAEARLQQARLDADADVAAARAQARSAEARLGAAQQGEAAAAEAYRLARVGYDAGRLPLLELSSARRALSAARIATIDARLARVRAEAESARLAGRAPFGA